MDGIMYLLIVLDTIFINNQKENKMNIKQKICNHKKYKITYCEKSSRYYLCKCEKCGWDFDLPKATDEIYKVNTIIEKR